MRLSCPRCQVEVRGEAVDIAADQATCPACGDVFSASGELPPSSETIARGDYAPTTDKLFYEEQSDGTVNLLLPARGLRGRAIGFFVFGLVWNALILPFTIALATGNMEMDGDMSPLFAILFLIPFWAVGIVMLFFAFWHAYGTFGLRLDRRAAHTIRQLFGYSREYEYPLAGINRFNQEVAYEENYEPVFAVTLVAGKSKMHFGHDLSGADQEWLILQLNAALERLRGR